MSLIDILILGWLVNVVCFIITLVIGIISVSIISMFGKATDLASMQMVTLRHQKVMNQVPEDIKRKITRESIIKQLLPFSGILKLLKMLIDLHSVGYNPLMLLEKESDEYIEKYNLKDVM